MPRALRLGRTPELAECIVGLVVGVVGVGCGGKPPAQLSFVNHERPSGYNAPSPTSGMPPSPTTELGDDDFLEPERPLADTKQQRALVHIHGPKDICSGVVLGPRIVATAHRCLRGRPAGAAAVGEGQGYRVEIASSGLTWTNRAARYTVLPACDVGESDVAFLVLEEIVPPLVVPLRVVSAPGAGARVNALGFGHCVGSSPSPQRERTGSVRSRASTAVVIDVSLCKGDVGGPVIDGRDGEVVGLISHRDDPEGSPLRTATIARLDTTVARGLLEQAKSLSEGAPPTAMTGVRCR